HTERLYNLIKKKIYKYFTYKEKLRKIYRERHPDILTSKYETYDYGLVINPGTLPIDELNFIRERTNCLVAFQFDAIKMHPNALKVNDFFNCFFVFDPQDMQRFPDKKFLPSTNFYFDYCPAKKESGSHHKITDIRY